MLRDISELTFRCLEPDDDAEMEFLLSRMMHACDPDASDDHADFATDIHDCIRLGCYAPCLIALVEVRARRPDWAAAEMRIACPFVRFRDHILGHLLQLAAFQLGKRHCCVLLVPKDPQYQIVVDFLSDFPQLGFDRNFACIDISGYADMVA